MPVEPHSRCLAIAARLRGQVASAGWLGGASVRFTLHERAALFEFSQVQLPGDQWTRNTKVATEISVDLTGCSPGALKIAQVGFASVLPRIFGKSAIPTGDRLFDSLYGVRASPESIVERIFSPERKDHVIASVRRIGTYVDPLIDVSWNRLLVQVAERLESERSLLNLVETASDFTGYILNTPTAEEIVWGRAGLDPGGKCPVCGAPLGTSVVLSSSCRTPHHEECWLYLGKCSTFACRATTFS